MSVCDVPASPTDLGEAKDSFLRTFFADGWAEEAFLERWGVTRVGDLTELDTIGIPGWFACRPNSRSLSVSQGKGLTPAQARISAVMEALEGAVAEQTTALISEIGSVNELRGRGLDPVPLNQLQRCSRESVDPDRDRAWVRGRVLHSGMPVYAPYELIGLDMRPASQWDHSGFRMSTIGLGAGRSELQAVLHALCELVENDATTLVEVFGVTSAARQFVNCDNPENDDLRTAISMVRAAGFQAIFVDVTGAIPIPTIGCFLQIEMPGFDRERVSLTAGFACRPRASDAALAALLEATQSRLTTIAGSREDLRDQTFSSGYKPFRQTGSGGTDIAALTPSGWTAAAGDPKRALDFVVQTIADNSKASDIFVFSLTEPSWPFNVVRVLVPRLESVEEGGMVRLGDHAVRRLFKKGDGP